MVGSAADVVFVIAAIQVCTGPAAAFEEMGMATSSYWLDILLVI